MDEQRPHAPEGQEHDPQRAWLRRALADDLRQVSYGEAYVRAVRWNQLFHEELAAALAPRLNEHLATVPQQTIEQMRDVATGLNAQLKQLGLAIRSPAGGHASWLVAETKSAAEPGVCRYRFFETNERGRAKRRLACRTLPALTLMPLPARIESFAKRYADRAGDEDRGPQR